MKQKIQIVSIKFPKKGDYIDRGTYDYVTTQTDEPSFSFRWSGSFLRRSKDEFIFARDVIHLFRIPDDATTKLMKAYSAEMMRNATGAAGMLLSVAFGAVGSAITKNVGQKGFGAIYDNKSEHKCLFVACAQSEIVDSIFSSVPNDRIQDNDSMLPRNG